MDVITYLADRGYGSPDHIMDTFSADEIVEFYERSTKHYAAQLADDLIVGRHAQHADEKAMKKYMKELENRMNPKEDKFLSPDEVLSTFKGFLQQ